MGWNLFWRLIYFNSINRYSIFQIITISSILILSERVSKASWDRNCYHYGKNSMRERETERQGEREGVICNCSVSKDVCKYRSTYNVFNYLILCAKTYHFLNFLILKITSYKEIKCKTNLTCLLKYAACTALRRIDVIDRLNMSQSTGEIKPIDISIYRCWLNLKGFVLFLSI